MKVVKEVDIDKFDNGQMLIHFGEIYDKIKLNSDDVISVELYGIVKEVNSEIIKCIITYFKLEKKYKLESETLLNEIIIRMGSDFSHISKDHLKEFFNKIHYNIKLLKEKDKMREKIVWLKNIEH